jgi:hypothetical protein
MAWKPSYVETVDLRNFARISDTIDDTQIALAITAASRGVDKHTHRQFGLLAAAEEWFYTAEWDRKRRCWVIEVDDFQTETGLLIHADLDDDETYSYAIDDYSLKPANAAAKGRPWEKIIVRPDSTYQPNGKEDAVRVTARFGWTTTPDAVKEATLLQGNRLLARRSAPFGVAGSPETGSEVRLLAKLDPDVATSLTDYVRWWAAA